MASLAKVLPGLVEPGSKILIDSARTPLTIASALKACKAKPVEAADPCVLFKAKKNKIELQGARNAHLRDGAALCRFLAWLDAEAPSGMLDELTASDKLEAFRRDTNLLEDLSFDTISGAGSNGAIVHYRATPETNKKLLAGHALSHRLRRTVPRRNHRCDANRRDWRACRRDAAALTRSY